MKPDVWHSLCCLHNVYLFKTFLLQLITLEKSLYSTHHPLTNTVQEPLLHLPTQYKSLCSTHHSLNTQEPLLHSLFTQHSTIAFVPFTQQHSTTAFTQQHITGPFAPLTICTATQYWILWSTHQQYKSLCSTHHLFNNTVQGTGTVQGPLLHSPSQCRSLCSTHHSLTNTVQEPLLNNMLQGPLLHHSCNNTLHHHSLNSTVQEPLFHSPTQYRSLCSIHSTTQYKSSLKGACVLSCYLPLALSVE